MDLVFTLKEYMLVPLSLSSLALHLWFVLKHVEIELGFVGVYTSTWHMLYKVLNQGCSCKCV
jgi:hypothetical protein